MRLTRKAAVVGAMFALTSVFTLAACSDDSNDATQDLSGGYVVTGFWTGAANGTPAPTTATGTADLTSDTYNITINQAPTPTIVSNGTYAAFQDGSFTQNGTTKVGDDAPFDTQCTGTWALSGVVLTLDTTCSGVRSVVQLEPAV